MSVKRDRASLEREMRTYDWYHRIDLGDGLVTPGRDYDFMWQPTLEFMSACSFRGKRVLDIGCWDGMFSFFAERQGAAQVVGTDVESHPTQRFARKALRSKVKFKKASVYRLPRVFGKESFDVVIFNSVLYHLMMPLLALLSINAVLKRGGTLLVESAYYNAGAEQPLIFVSFGEDEIYRGDVSSCTFPTPNAYRHMPGMSLFSVQRLLCYHEGNPAGRLLIEATKTASAEERPYDFYEYVFDVLDL